MSKIKILTKGFFKENPSLILVLGMCPTLAVTTSVNNAIGMSAATTFVLLMSNLIISLLKNVIPDKVRIPCFIVIIATFVSIVDLIIQGFVPALSESLGVFIPLIVVNCIVLGRAEAFASKNGARFYGLPENSRTITLIKQSQKVPESVVFGDNEVVPMCAGQEILWSIQAA